MELRGEKRNAFYGRTERKEGRKRKGRKKGAATLTSARCPLLFPPISSPILPPSHPHLSHLDSPRFFPFVAPSGTFLFFPRWFALQNAVVFQVGAAPRERADGGQGKHSFFFAVHDRVAVKVPSAKKLRIQTDSNIRRKRPSCWCGRPLPPRVRRTRAAMLNEDMLRPLVPCLC